MRQYRVLRKAPTLNIQAGQTLPIDLPRSYDYEAIYLRLSGSLQVTVAATSVRAEAPLQLVPRIVVISDGKNVLFNAPMWACSLARIDRELAASGARCTTPPSAVGIATYAVEAIGVIDFATVDAMRPKDSNFRTSALSMFQLIATFGQPGDPFVGGTVNFSGQPTLEVFTQEMIELPDIDPATGQPSFTSPIMLRKVSFLQQAFAASNPNAEIRLPAGNLMKSVLARTEGVVTAGEPSTAMLNNAILQSGLDVRHNLTGPQIRAKNNADFGQITSGYYMLDMVRNGPSPERLTELWDLSGQVEPKLVVDVVGGANNNLMAVVTEYIPAK
jgi:hypothetical protein